MGKVGGQGGAPLRERFALVDSMRALAAISVLFFHVTYQFPAPGTGLGEFVTQRDSGLPIAGVVLFFAISGFVLYRPFVAAHFAGRPDPELFAYGVRRFARIVPAYWVALGIAALWLNLHEVLSPTGALRYFGLAQLYGDTRTALGGIRPAWTLCVEISFYAVLPLLALGARRLGRPGSLRGPLTMCALMAGGSLLWQAVVLREGLAGAGRQFLTLGSLPASLDLFAVGMALAAVSVALEHRERRSRLTLAAGRFPWAFWITGLALWYAAGRLTDAFGSAPGRWWMWTAGHELKALGAVLLLVPVVIGLEHGGLLRRALGWRPLIWLGMVSYGIYLWHVPLLREIGPHVVPHGEAVTALALLALTVAVAAASFYIVERPAQRVARRWLKARQARTPAIVGVETAK